MIARRIYRRVSVATWHLILPGVASVALLAGTYFVGRFWQQPITVWFLPVAAAVLTPVWTVVLKVRQVRRAAGDVIVDDRGLTTGGHAIRWSAIRRLTRIPSAAAECYGPSQWFRLGDSQDTLLVIEHVDGTVRRTTTLPEIVDWEQLEADIREHARYLSIMDATTVREGAEWVDERDQLASDLASDNAATRAYAIDLLRKYAALGQADAADLLDRHGLSSPEATS